MSIKIAHISDIHITKDDGGRFNRKAFKETVREVNKLDFDLVLHTGDITDQGVKEQYEEAAKLLSEFNPSPFFIPGNHDSRNLGYELYGEYFEKPKAQEIHLLSGKVNLIALDTTIPDLDEVILGNSSQKKFEKSLFKCGDRFTIVALHHHLIPVPAAGRSRNLIQDAGDVLEILTKKRCVDMILSGHRHVPSSFQVEDTVVINAGTVSSLKTRGHHGHSFNMIEINDSEIKVYEKKYEDNFEPTLILGKKVKENHSPFMREKMEFKGRKIGKS